MTFRLGLTGSIGMGKTTTAAMFREAGVPVWDADATVHRLYQDGGAAIGSIAALVPEAVNNGSVDRSILKAAIKVDPSLLERIERIVHPLVAQDRQEFLAAHREDALVVLDIPLLFETGGDAFVDATLVVTTNPATQSARVMARPGMTQALFDDLLSRQMPDAEKRHRADHIIHTETLDQTRRDVKNLIARLIGQENGQEDA